jgi:two-component system nitrogen regulation response regulator NtrX
VRLKILLDLSVEKVLKRKALMEKEKLLTQELSKYQNVFSNAIHSLKDIRIITQNQKMKELIKKAETFANSKAAVLITGESGTGKELFAQWIHYKSNRKDKAFVKINCSAIPENLFESELFGYEKGAFTGAFKSKAGKFEQSSGGTLFLDEIGDLPLSQQAKLLRILEDKELARIGGSETIKLDVRIICATNRDLSQMSTKGAFRNDLFYRLNVLKLHMPSLSERKEDISLLSFYFLNLISNDEGGPEKYLDESASLYLEQLKFPGNIRELKNFTYRLYFHSKEKVITRKDIEGLTTDQKTDQTASGPFDKTVFFSDFKNEMEALYLKRQLEIFDYNITQTAKALGMPSSNLCRKLKALNIRVSKNL